MTGEYTFGDTDLAAERLALVAEIFDPVSRRFLGDVIDPGGELAIDLGCGPGHTTLILAEIARAHRTLGLDRSPHFITLARTRTPTHHPRPTPATGPTPPPTATDERGATGVGGDAGRVGDRGTHTGAALLGPTNASERGTGPAGGTVVQDVSGVRRPASLAGRGGGGVIEFGVHDVTEVPLPGAPADVIHARLLLAHLPDPRGLVDRWRSQLRPGGVLLLDEIESMTTPPGALRRYEDLVVALVAAEGGAMSAGPALADLGGRLPEVDVADGRAARMYGMNLATWRHEARRRGLADDAELDRLAADLADLAEHPAGDAVHWVLRQIAVPAPV